MSDSRDLSLYLAMLAGRDRTGYLEQRGPGPDGRWASTFHRTDRLDPMAEQLLMVGKARPVYVGCAPRTHRHGGLDAIGNVYCIWTDHDGPESVARLDNFRHRPTVVIRSGTGPNRHAYWQLSRPLDAGQAGRALRRLAHHLGADMACAEPARILRPPFTTNHKSDPPAVVDLEHLDVTAHDPAELVGHLPDPPTRTTAPKPARTPYQGDDPLSAIAPAVYMEALTGQVPDTTGKVCCPLPGHDDATPSCQVYPDADRGWYCFGCGRGGRVYDLAALLAGYRLPLRGADFIAVRDVLNQHLGVAA